MENCSYQSNTESYQPNRAKGLSSISILPILSIVYEKQVLHQIADLIETQQVYNKHQSGYRKNNSTVTVLSKLCDDIKLAMKESELTMVVFTNYSKALLPEASSGNFKPLNFFLQEDFTRAKKHKKHKSIKSTKRKQTTSFFWMFFIRIKSIKKNKKQKKRKTSNKRLSSS